MSNANIDQWPNLEAAEKHFTFGQLWVLGSQYADLLSDLEANAKRLAIANADNAHELEERIRELQGELTATKDDLRKAISNHAADLTAVEELKYELSRVTELHKGLMAEADRQREELEYKLAEAEKYREDTNEYGVMAAKFMALEERAEHAELKLAPIRAETWEKAKSLVSLVFELSDAVDNAEYDTGGSRPQLDILRDAVQVAQEIDTLRTAAAKEPK